MKNLSAKSGTTSDYTDYNTENKIINHKNSVVPCSPLQSGVVRVVRGKIAVVPKNEPNYLNNRSVVRVVPFSPGNVCQF